MERDTLKTFLLFVCTAIAEIVGCYLPYLWLKQSRPVWLLVPATLSVALFAWLLALHLSASGRVDAAHGGIYIGVAMGWLMSMDKIRSTPTDWIGTRIITLGLRPE